ncbi:DUF4169 family protein [Ancylobacter oerskovii]|uniref:DUF4169 family protein n=1 Tax=Ancylobacter oerskovii TaxID=459519 RepID=A0ABW4YT55_9HYPH|nr:DUF4169 family protein [Ancylobacter oerskovii]MBS7545174.1 DUF4169 family protein [Ancylobacter oerskovii]
MADLVNLHRYRKKKAREAAEQTAAERRLAFGVSKAQKNADADARRRNDAALDGHKRIREDET